MANELNFDQYPYLKRAREFSTRTLKNLSDSLGRESHHGVATIYIAGSLGRLEASNVADVDCVVLSDGHHEQTVAQAFPDVHRALSETGLKLPKSDGIYARVGAPATVWSRRWRGDLNEPKATFGKRLQCLLDGRAIYRPSAFADLQQRTLCWYEVGNDPQNLVDEVKRYLYTYRVWQRFSKVNSESDSWALRQIKLRGPRLITFAGLLMLLSDFDLCHQAKFVKRLSLSPLERIAAVGEQHQLAVSPIVALYDQYLSVLNDPGIRAAMIASVASSNQELTNEPWARESNILELAQELENCLNLLFVALRPSAKSWSVF
ncbi:MAG: hypothetical protein AAF384_11350 [Pseudomonadota bacterium]